MPGQDKTPLGDFNDNIDSAIDNLFTAKRKIEIDPLTNEVRAETTPKAPPMPGAEDKELSPSPSPTSQKTDSTKPPADMPMVPKAEDKQKEPAAHKLNILVTRLEQNFLTLDWEVTKKGVTDFQAVLTDIKRLLRTEEPAVHKVISFMGQILTTMASSPENVPPAAARTLKKGIALLKRLPPGNQELQGDLKKAAEEAIQELRHITSAIQSTAAGAGQTAEQGGTEFGDDLIAADLPEGRVPLALSNLINLHLTILAQCINRILPLEKLFGQNDLYKQYLADHREVREMLEEEKDRLAAALNADYSDLPFVSSRPIPEGLLAALESHLPILRQCQEKIEPIEDLAKRKNAKKLYKVEHEIRQQLENQNLLLSKVISGDVNHAESMVGMPASNELQQVLEKLREGLGRSIKQVIPLENLFGKTKGYEKLHAAQKRIRLQLETQKKQLSGALEKIGTPPATPESALTSPKPQSAPWDKMLKASWNGQVVALLPDEIAFEDPSGKACKKISADLPTFAVNKLKAWPWTKLRPLVNGELADLTEAQLANFKLPPLAFMMPDLGKTSAGPPQGTLIILYRNGKGGNTVLDGPTEDFPIDKDWSWEPLPNVNGLILKGFLVRAQEHVPVLSVA